MRGKNRTVLVVTILVFLLSVSMSFAWEYILNDGVYEYRLNRVQTAAGYTSVYRGEAVFGYGGGVYGPPQACLMTGGKVFGYMAPYQMIFNVTGPDAFFSLTGSLKQEFHPTFLDGPGLAPRTLSQGPLP